MNHRESINILEAEKRAVLERQGILDRAWNQGKIGSAKYAKLSLAITHGHGAEAYLAELERRIRLYQAQIHEDKRRIESLHAHRNAITLGAMLLIILAGFSLLQWTGVLGPVGLVTGGDMKETRISFSQDIPDSGSYLMNISGIEGLKLSGSVNGTGFARVYMRAGNASLLVLSIDLGNGSAESAQGSSGGMITGFVVDEPGQGIQAAGNGSLNGTAPDIPSPADNSPVNETPGDATNQSLNLSTGETANLANDTSNQSAGELPPETLKGSSNGSLNESLNESLNATPNVSLSSENISANQTQTLNGSLNESANETINEQANETINESANGSLNETPPIMVNATANEPANATQNETLPQETNSSANASMNETLNESMNESLNESMNESINETLNATLNEPLNTTLIPNETIAPNETIVLNETAVPNGTIQNATVRARAINFTDACAETCLLPFAVDEPRLVFELENASLHLDGITYLTRVHNNPPALVAAIPNMSLGVGENWTINASVYFQDPENDSLIFDAASVPGLRAAIAGDLITFTPEANGSFTTYAYATDGQSLTQSNDFTITTAMQNGSNTTSNTTSNVTVDAQVIAALASGPVRVILEFKQATPSVDAAHVLSSGIPRGNPGDSVSFLQKGIDAKALETLRHAGAVTPASIADLRNAHALKDTKNAAANAPAAGGKGGNLLTGNVVETPSAPADASAPMQGLAPAASSPSDAAIADQLNASDLLMVEQELPNLRAKSAVITSADLDALRRDSRLSHIRIDQPMAAMTFESFNITRITQVQQSGYAGNGTRICILDTGLNYTLFGLALNQSVVGQDFVNADPDPMDDNGHGTEVSYPIINAARGAQIIVGKVIDQNGQGYSSDVIAGLQYCMSQNASIVSMSIGGGGSAGYCDDDLVAQAVDNLSAQGVLVVAATGNDGSGIIKSPACARGALAVGASTKQDALAAFTNANNATILLAPGAGINTVDQYGQAVVASGTSLAVPFVTAAAALVRQNSSIAMLNSSELGMLLIHTGQVIPGNGRLFARLDAYNALIRNITNNLTPSALATNESLNATFTPLDVQLLASYSTPTPLDGVVSLNSSATINVSITNASALNRISFDWNGSTTTFFNSSLVFFMNFDNVSALGEGSNNISQAGASGGLPQMRGECRQMNGNCNYTQGVYGMAMSFTGNGALVYIPNNNSLNTTNGNGFTVAAWVLNRNATTKAWESILEKGWDQNPPAFNAPYISWALAMNGTGKRFDFQLSNSNTLTETMGNTVPSPNTWYHVVGVWNGTTTFLYVNGQIDGPTRSLSGPPAFNNQSLFIGNGRFQDNQYAWNGLIDDVMVFNRSLSAAEVATLYRTSIRKTSNSTYLFLVNQSITQNGTYTYRTTVVDSAGAQNVSTRVLYEGIWPELPALAFNSPTPGNNSNAPAGSGVIINISVNTTGLKDFAWNWNGTNVQFYNDSLVLLLNLNNASSIGENATRAVDISRYGNNGTVNGATLNSTGRYGNAYEFDFGDSINLGNPPTFPNGTQNRTLCLWARARPSQPSDGFAFWYGSELTGGAFGILRTNGGLDMAINLWSGTGYNVGNFWIPGTWQHICTTWDGQNITVYTNGTQIGTAKQMRLNTTLANAFVGSEFNAQYFNGSIDDVYLFNKTLNATEINQIYKSSFSKYAPDGWQFITNQTNLTAGIYSYYGFASEVSGNSNTTGTNYLNSGVYPPTLLFIAPTPGDNSFLPPGSEATINASINESNLANMVWNWSGTTAPIYNDSLLFAYDFDNISVFGEGSGKNRTFDFGRYANNGTCLQADGVTGMACNFTAGRYGLGVSIGNAQSFVGNLPNYQMYEFNGMPFTVSAWIYSTGTLVGDQAIAAYATSTGNEVGWEFIYNGSQLRFRYDSSGSIIALASNTNTNLVKNVWNHVVVVVNATGNGNATTYLNGQFDGSILLTGNVGSTGGGGGELRIGAAGGNGASPFKRFNGSIDEVRIYNRTLLPSEISELYKTNLNKYAPDGWMFSANETNLTAGAYTYSLNAADTTGFSNTTGTNNLNIGFSVPAINFSTPTPGNGSMLSPGSSAIVNISLNESSLRTFTWNWNATNLTVYNSSLILMYNFDNASALGENSTSNSTYDAGPNSINGACVNMTFGCNWTTGRYGGGLSLSSKQYVNTGQDLRWSRNDSFTFSLWVNPSVVSGDLGMIGYGSNGAYGLISEGTLVHYSQANSSGTPDTALSIDAPGVLTAGAWTHIVMTYNGSSRNASLYINANYKNSSIANSDFVYPGNTLTIGYVVWFGANYFNGTIDEMRIYNRTLSPLDIQQIYSSNFNKYAPDGWQFLANESSLPAGTYTYYGYAMDTTNTTNTTGVNTLTIGNPPPGISFVSPTPANGSTQYLGYNATINISINESALGSFIWTWNSTNTTLHNSSLVLMMNFDNVSALGESPSSNFALDAGPYGTSGTCMNMTLGCNWTAGKWGAGLSFDGQNDLVVVNHTGSLNITNHITMSAWINVHSENYQVIYTKPYLWGFNTAPYEDYAIYTGEVSPNSNGRTQFQAWITNTTGDLICAPTYGENLNLNTWNHVVATYDGTTILTYINGVLDSSCAGAGDIAENVTPLIIGANPAWQQNFNGTIDEVRIYNTTMTPTQIQQLYVSNLNKYAPDGWQFIANESNLSIGMYSYYATATDTSGPSNTTGTNTLNILATPFVTIQFIAPTPANSTFTTNSSTPFNVSINSSIANLSQVNWSWRQSNYPVYDPTLTLMMDFDNATGVGESGTSPFVYDASPWLNNGSCMGSAQCNWTIAGRFGSALGFNGSAFVSTNVTEGIVTIAYWYRNKTDTRWTYVVNASGTLYVNGASATPAWQPIFVNNTKNIQIGKLGPTGFFNGTIDEVRIWNRTLSATEVAQQFAVNLNKYARDGWTLSANETTTNGQYIYQSCMSDVAGNSNCTEVRYLFAGDYYPPTVNFTAPTPTNGTITANLTTIFNVSITNGTDIENFNWSWQGNMYNLYDPSIVTWYNFDNISVLGEGSNQNWTYDLTGSGTNGTCTGMFRGCNYTAGKYGQGIILNGINQYIDTNRDLRWYWGNSFSMSLWAKPKTTASSATGTMIGYGTNDAYTIFQIGADLYFVMDNAAAIPGNPTLTVSGALAANTWTHAAVTYNGATKKFILYVNGVAAASGSPTTDFLYGGNHMTIGTGDYFGAGFFNGTLDEVRVYNRTLSPAEIMQLYSTSLNRIGASNWTFVANESTANGFFPYQACVGDFYQNWNCTVIQYLYGGDYFSPTLIYGVPTPANNTFLTRSNYQNPYQPATINISINNASDLGEFSFNWNGTVEDYYNNSLVLMYNFENLSSVGDKQSIVADQSLYGNNATVVQGGCPTWSPYPFISSPGKFGKAWNSSGQSSYMVNTTMSTFPQEHGSISIWALYPEENSQTVMSGDPSTNNIAILAVMNGVDTEIAFRDGANANHCSRDITGGNQYHLGNGTSWNNIILTWDTVALTCATYYNGVLLDNGSLDAGWTPTGNSMMMLGNDWNCDGQMDPGAIDELRVYNKTLTATEVNEIYQSNLAHIAQANWTFTTTRSLRADVGPARYQYSATAFDIYDNPNSTGTNVLYATNLTTPVGYNPNWNFTFPRIGDGIGGNVINDSSFENLSSWGGNKKWNFYFDATPTGNCQIAQPGFVGSNATVCYINSTLGSGGNQQLYQYYLSVRANTQYRLHFMAKETSNADGLYIRFMYHESPYDDWIVDGNGNGGAVINHVNLTKSWDYYTLYFNTSSQANNSGRLTFMLNYYDRAGDAYWFDDIGLETYNFSTGPREKIISGTPYNWTFQNYTQYSGRKVRYGTPYSWVWVDE